MRDLSGQGNVWLLEANVLTVWCRHRPTGRKTVMTVNDTWRRALERVHE